MSTQYGLRMHRLRVEPHKRPKFHATCSVSRLKSLILKIIPRRFFFVRYFTTRAVSFSTSSRLGQLSPHVSSSACQRG